ncbi:insulin receptor substrate 2-A-like [Betta splendens]|uniref:Insulin receptor substrate 2-A-like n=1 Tax=Betta splendens TaxID=158456 RepID=A0A6P7KL26_BETSP|nr:insulin receptor substrate 2-A-like [Betta splendens]
MAEGHSACDNQQANLPSSSSPLSSACYSSFQTWLPGESPRRPLWTAHQQDHPIRAQLNELPPSTFYEELVCSSQSSAPLVRLSGAKALTASGPQGDVVKQGYLGKLEQNQKRYFVLKAGSHTGPSRLEWYKNQEKFSATGKSSGKAALVGSSKQGVIYLRCCLGVSRIGSSRKGHTVALYTKNQTVVLVMEDQQEQDEWYQSVRKLMEEEHKDEEQGQELDEEDDGYCTLPAAAFYKEVWPVTVKPRGLGRSKSLAGEARLCLTATALVLVRVCACNDLPSVKIPLLSVRRFGHLDGSFFLELGRSAPNGPGEIWMEATDQGNSAVAQNIHEVIRETVQALRALPDFSRSPSSSNSHPQALLASKRSRPKYRDKCLNVRPTDLPLALPHSVPDIHSSPTQNHLEPCNADKTDASALSFTFRTPQRSTCDTDSYVEMKTDQSWELGDEGERQGYVMMFPQLNHTSSLPKDDYVIMSSPHKDGHSAHSSFSLQTFNSSTSEGCSPLHPSHHQPKEHHLSHWLVTSVRQWEAQKDHSQISISSADATQTTQGSTTSPVLGLMAPSDVSGPVYTRPDQSSPLQAAEFKPARRHRLLSCLPACLQAEEK